MKTQRRGPNSIPVAVSPIAAMLERFRFFFGFTIHDSAERRQRPTAVSPLGVSLSVSRLRRRPAGGAGGAPGPPCAVAAWPGGRDLREPATPN